MSPHMITACLSSRLVPAGKKNADKGIFVPTDISTLERPKLGGGRGRKNLKKKKKRKIRGYSCNQGYLFLILVKDP